MSMRLKVPSGVGTTGGMSSSRRSAGHVPRAVGSARDTVLRVREGLSGQDGTFEAPTNDCQRGQCKWSANKGKAKGVKE